MIILQDRTREMIDQTLADSPHAILLNGPVGSGKLHTARYLSHKVLRTDSLESLQDYPYFQEIKAAGSSISIDQIRQIQDFTKLKTPGAEKIRRIIIIEDAHHMTNEAQNALLKILEEPPADTMIILTAVQTLNLNDTIYSRVRQIPILPVSKEMLFDFFGQSDKDTMEKAYTLSNGLPGLFYAILGSADHQLIGAIKLAKDVLGTPAYQRLLQVDTLAKQKDQVPVFLQACRLICSTLLRRAIHNNDKKKSRQFVSAIQAIYTAESSLQRNPNYKLMLTDLLLQV